jgi:HAD superfamily hydrolase (TIGR01549 family)
MAQLNLSRTPFVIFDAYGTLVELDDFYGRLQQGFARAGLSLSPEAIKRAAHAEMKHYIERSVQARDEESWIKLRLECAQVLADALREQGHQIALSAEKTAQILSDSIQFRVFPEAIAVLEKLHAMKVPMGVLSNWDYELPHIFERLGLKKYFSFVLSSAEIGAPKPAPETFAAAIERARKLLPNIKPRDMFYVGDHYEKDVLPARRAGLTPLWLVRNERDLASGELVKDDKVLRLDSLRNLLRFIGRGD